MISLCMGTTLCMCLPQTTTAQTVSSGDSWTWDKGTIVIDTPERPAGQKSVLGLTTPKMEVVRVGFVGLGMRGPGAVERFTRMFPSHVPSHRLSAGSIFGDMGEAL